MSKHRKDECGDVIHCELCEMYPAEHFGVCISEEGGRFVDICSRCKNRLRLYPYIPLYFTPDPVKP